jgi:hypothetical protein
MEETKQETKKIEGQQPEEGDLVVQELFFENYATPQTVPEELSRASEQPERKSLVRRIAKSAMLGLLMLGSLVFAGLALSGQGRRRTSRFASLRRRFVH